MIKNHLRLGLVGGLILAVLLVSSCANIQNDRKRTQAEGTLAGAGGGAILGAVIGGIAGGHRGAAVGAAVGAGVGALGGLAYGTHVANKKTDYASQEAWLADCLKQAQAANQEITAYNNQLRTTVAKYDQDTNALNAKYKAQTAKKSELNKMNKNLQAEIKKNEKTLAALQNEIESQEKVLAETVKDKDSAQLTKKINTELASLRKQKGMLTKSNQELAAMSSRMSA